MKLEWSSTRLVLGRIRFDSGLGLSSARKRHTLNSPCTREAPIRFRTRAPHTFKTSSPARRCPTRNRDMPVRIRLAAHGARHRGRSAPRVAGPPRSDSLTGKALIFPRWINPRLPHSGEKLSRSSRVRRTGSTLSLPSSQLSSTPGRLLPDPALPLPHGREDRSRPA